MKPIWAMLKLRQFKKGLPWQSNKCVYRTDPATGCVKYYLFTYYSILIYIWSGISGMNISTPHLWEWWKTLSNLNPTTFVVFLIASICASGTPKTDTFCVYIIRLLLVNCAIARSYLAQDEGIKGVEVWGGEIKVSVCLNTNKKL